MINHKILNPKFVSHLQNSIVFIFPSFLHTRSLSPYKPKPSNWNTNHSFIKSNPVLSLLEKCNSMTQLFQIQAQMTTSGLILDGLASSRLIAFCAISQSGDLDYSLRILKFVDNPKIFSWNIAIKGYSDSIIPLKSVELYKEMLGIDGCRPDNYTYPLIFKVCARLSLSYTGYGILGHVLKLGFASDLYVVNGIIHMLVCCGSLDDARNVFDESRVRDLVTWNSLINGYVHCGKGSEVLKLYEQMRVEGVRPDEVTMIGMVASCGQLEDLSRGLEFHRLVGDCGLDFTVPLCNALMDMYVKCGDLKPAQEIFDSMRKKTMVSWTTMVVGYARFGLLDEARRLFDKMPEKDVVPWNAMIGAYVQAKCSKEALALFHEMQGANVTPDEITMVNCLSACSQLGALDIGTWCHWYINKKKLSLNVSLGTALVDMYAKCGNVGKALEVFHVMPLKNSLTWTAIIGGLALHGNANDALSYFMEMIIVGLVPDEITYLGVLTACCHGGLVDEGRKYFAEMTSKYNLNPSLKHYSCMVDLLGRAGKLEDAEALIKSMPMVPNAAVWGALFFACHKLGNVIMGENAAQKLLELDPGDSGIYILLANMYGDAEMWDKARRERKMMKERGLDKTPGCSSIEVKGVIHEFTIRDKSHHQSKEIFECLVQLTKQLESLENVLSVSTS